MPQFRLSHIVQVYGSPEIPNDLKVHCVHLYYSGLTKSFNVSTCLKLMQEHQLAYM